jgi:hypothetical protein
MATLRQEGRECCRSVYCNSAEYTKTSISIYTKLWFYLLFGITVPLIRKWLRLCHRREYWIKLINEMKGGYKKVNKKATHILHSSSNISRMREGELKQNLNINSWRDKFDCIGPSTWENGIKISLKEIGWLDVNGFIQLRAETSGGLL